MKIATPPPVSVIVPANRTRHPRFNDLIDREPIPTGTDYASVIEADIPIVVQHSPRTTRVGAGSILFRWLEVIRARRPLFHGGLASGTQSSEGLQCDLEAAGGCCIGGWPAIAVELHDRPLKESANLARLGIVGTNLRVPRCWRRFAVIASVRQTISGGVHFWS